MPGTPPWICAGTCEYVTTDRTSPLAVSFLLPTPVLPNLKSPNPSEGAAAESGEAGSDSRVPSVQDIGLMSCLCSCSCPCSRRRSTMLAHLPPPISRRPLPRPAAAPPRRRGHALLTPPAGLNCGHNQVGVSFFAVCYMYFCLIVIIMTFVLGFCSMSQVKNFFLSVKSY